jgi:rubrerythrin
MLETAERIERLSEELYRTFARALADYEGLKAAFEQLAGDEAEHVECLRMLVQARRGHPSADREIAVDTDRLDLMIGEMRMAIDLVRASSDPGSIARLVRWALDMEREVGAIHADKLALEVCPEIGDLLTLLAEQDATHVARLEQIASRLA